MALEEEFDDDPMRRVVDLGHWRYFFLPAEDRAPLDVWKGNGKCWNKPEMVELFNPPVEEDDDGKPSTVARITTSEAKKFCNGDDDGMTCSIRKECMQYAIDHRIYFGVWGGMTVRERRKEAAKQAKKRKK